MNPIPSLLGNSTRPPFGAWPARHALVLLGLVLAVGCRGAGSIERSGLAPLELPSLTSFDPAIRAEIEQRAATVQALLARRESPNEKLAEAFGSLGRILDAHELDSAAARCYDNASRLAPQEFAWPYLQGHLALRRGAAPAAAAAFERALEISPDQPHALVGAARAAALEGRWAESRQLAKRALGREPGFAFAWTVLASAQMQEGDAAGAAASYDQALQLQPEATRLHSLRATALARAGDAASARAEQRLSGEGIVAVDDPWLRQLAVERRDAVGRREAGERAFLAGDFATARAEFAAAVAADPAAPESHVGLGSTLARTGLWQEAADEFREAIRLAPDHAVAHFNLAVALQRLGTGSSPAARESAEREAKKHYLAALAADAGRDDARYNLANLLRRGGKCAEAVPEYELLLTRNPGRAAAAVGLAACMARQGNFAASLAAIDRGLAAAAGDGSLLTARARLLAAAPRAELRRGAEALALSKAIVAAGRTPWALETLAMALAETGDLPGAREQQRAALAAAQATATSPAALARLQKGLELYDRGQPCRDPALD